MIPRTKVNYTWRDLLGACFVVEKQTVRRALLVDRLSQFLACRQVLLTASGRGALFALLRCLPHERVIVPAYTCKAVVEAVLLAGKEPIFAECEDGGFNMSLNSLSEILDSNSVVVATHQFGFPCDMEAILHVARKANAFVIEDAAASLGTRIGGRPTGTFGDAAFFSFDSTKLVNAPLKAGFLTTKDPELYRRCAEFLEAHTRPMTIGRKLIYILLGGILVSLENPYLYRLFHNLKFRWRGRFTDDSAEMIGTPSPFHTDRLAEWQAYILLAQIQNLDEIVSNRRRLYAQYLTRLAGLRNVELPPADAAGEWAPIRFPIRVKGDKLDFYEQSVQRGIDYAFSFTFIASPPRFQIAHRLASSVLDLPFFHRLSDRELDTVVSVVRDVDRTHGG
jgi:dTDP-4-amino-4,6-dideoxygalactose transaminase